VQGVAVERTLVLVKPDGVRRGLVGEVISRFERKGLKIRALKMLWMTREQAEEFYSVHRDKPFYKDLVDFITSGPIVAMVLEGDSAISVVRLMIGATDGRKAQPGTIRGDFALSIQDNVVHASDSPESFEREFRVVFSDNDVVPDYKRC
jgi:nucleoside-diphosphate kinase